MDASLSSSSPLSPQAARIARIVAAQRAREAKFQQRETQNQQQQQQQQEQPKAGTGRRWVRRGAGWAPASATATAHEYTAPASARELPCALYAQLGLARGLRPGTPRLARTARTLAALVRHYGTPRGTLTRLVLADVDAAVAAAAAQQHGAACAAVADLVAATLAALDAEAARRTRHGMDARPEHTRRAQLVPALAALQQRALEEKSSSSSVSKEGGEGSVLDGVPDWEVREVLLRCSVASVGNAACTCRRLAALCADEALWARYAHRRGWQCAPGQSWRARAVAELQGAEGRAVLRPGLHYHRTAHEFLWVEGVQVTAQPYVAVTADNVVDILAHHQHYDTSYVKMTK